MWRSFLAVILLPSLTAAQSVPEVKPEISRETVNMILYGPPRTTAAPTSSYQSYTRHSAIRRGRDEEMGILLQVRGLVTAAKSPVPGIVPLTLEFEQLDGFTVKEVRGPEVLNSHFKFRGETVKVSGQPYLQFKIRAARDTSLGLHALKGKLTFQQVSPDGSGVGRVEQVEVSIPLTVVDHDAKVHQADLPYAPMPSWETVLLIASIPVLIVLFIPLLILCTVTGTCPSC